MAQKLISFVDKNGKHHDGFWVDTKTSVIYYRKTHSGKEIKFSCRSTNIINAKKFANKKLKEIFKPQKSAKLRKSLGELLALYKKERLAEEELAENTKKNIRNAVKKLEPFWGNKFPDEIFYDSWLEYCEWHQKQFNGQQIANELKYFRNFCRYLAEARKDRPAMLAKVPRLVDPRAKKDRVERKKKKHRTFTDAEFQNIFNIADDRLKVILLLMYTNAFRINEACGLRKSQLEQKGDLLIYRFMEGSNKAGLDGTDALHPVTAKYVRARMKAVKSDYLFPQENNPDKHLAGNKVIDWDELREAAQLGWHWTSHTFRHTCLTRLFNDPAVKDSYIIKTKRISYQEALRTYIHVTEESHAKYHKALEVKL